MDYVTRECWQKAVKPYTLYRDFACFRDDYLDQFIRYRTWNVNWQYIDYFHAFASNNEELELLNRWNNWIIDANAKIAAAPQEEWQKMADKLNADNAEMIEKVNKIFSSSKGQKVLRGINYIKRMKQEAFVLDSLGVDQIIKDVWLSQLVNSLIEETHTAVSPMVIDTLKSLIHNTLGIEQIEKANDYYLALENREFDKLVLKSSDNLADLSEGEALLKKILEPYKGKFVLLDVWGIWCSPCREALSHSNISIWPTRVHRPHGRTLSRSIMSVDRMWLITICPKSSRRLSSAISTSIHGPPTNFSIATEICST